jgi:hypothetical protein
VYLQIEQTREIINKWKQKGFRTLNNGTEIICHVPLKGPEAWLHDIYAPLTEEQINTIERSVFTKKIPAVLKEFYREMNGINLFSDTFNVYGLRFSYVRTGDESIQPYDLITPNLGRPKECPRSWLFFGSYSWDGSKVVMDTAASENPRVFRVERWTTNVLQEWESFPDWLNSETIRVEKLFNENGYRIDPEVPTV